jgi:hypothetical protein
MLETEASRERWTVRLALFALAVSFIALVITILQWRSAERAANVADQARKDSNTAAANALAVAELARQDAVTEAERQRIEAKNTLDQQRKDAAVALDVQTKLADRSAEQAKRSGDAANEQVQAAKDQAASAKSSVEAVQLQMRLDQRAWVTVDVGEKAGNFAVAMKNTGRSPAINVTEVTAFAGGKRMGPPDIDLNQNSSSPIPLPPNAPKEFLETLRKEGYIRDRPPTGYVIAPGATQIASDYQGKFTQIFRIDADRVYIQGRVTYDDVFGGPHETTFCYWFAPPSDFVMCNDHNKMN